MLMMAGGMLLALMRFCIAIRPPKVVVVSLQEASWIAALGAAALAHSASSVASPSLPPTTPGLVQLPGWTWVNEPPAYFDRPSAVRKVVQSEVLYTFVSSMTTMV